MPVFQISMSVNAGNDVIYGPLINDLRAILYRL
jgi:hypothetical protein